MSSNLAGTLAVGDTYTLTHTHTHTHTHTLRYHEGMSDELNNLTDGEAAAIGMGSALLEAPALTTQSLGDTVFVTEDSTSTETLAEMCVRQHNSSVFPQVRREYIKCNVLMDTKQGIFTEVCRPSFQESAELLKVTLTHIHTHIHGHGHTHACTHTHTGSR